MVTRTMLPLLFGLLALPAGCMSDGTARLDGITPGAGDAIAANSVMQMVDPWPAGVEDTWLRVPADRPLCPAAGCRSPSASGYGQGG